MRLQFWMPPQLSTKSGWLELMLRSSRKSFGTKARDGLAEKVRGKVVRVDVIDIDRNKQEVGRMYLGGRFINMELVRDGFAWRFIRFDLPGEFKAAEADARANKRGLWTDPHPVPPWQFRRQHAARGNAR